MNREMRRLMEREERRQKSKDKPTAAQRRSQAAGRAAQTESRSLWQRLVGFFHDVRQEMRKVSWPTNEQMVAFTTVTLITTIALTIVVFGLDVAMKEAVIWVVERT